MTAQAVIAAPTGNPAIYTTTDDFDGGTSINVVTADDEVKLDSTTEPFNFIWVAASGRGTIVKIDTVTGDVLGEYWSSPDGRWRNPSRTTVDANGNVWAGNRDEGFADGKGSVVHIGLEENGQCVDRNDNGVIDTSTGLADILAWPNTGGADDNGGVSTAVDECIIHYVRTTGTNVRTLAVDANNDLWTGGYTNRVHELVDGQTGIVVPGKTFTPSCGGYGGLIDPSGVLWSASLGSNALLRYDPATSIGSCIALGRTSYGLGIDTTGNIWHSNFGSNTVQKISPAGAILGTFNTFGDSGDRGVTVTPVDNHVWIANSFGSDVSRLDNNGVIQAVIPVGNSPMGMAVDGAGKVWVTNYSSHNAMRIDPATNAVDLTVYLGNGAYPYNYSDMTGSTLIAPPGAGTWSVVHDTGVPGAEWGTVSWNASTPGDSKLEVKVSSSEDGTTFGSTELVTSGIDLTVANGRYLKVEVSFTRASTGETPVLYDLTIAANLNDPPDCSVAVASVSTIWPPNHQFVPIDVLGVTDPDGDAVAITIDSIWQDEPVNTIGDGNAEPDGMGVGTATAQVRAERSGSKQVPGNGRFYHIGFSAADGQGGSCTGTVLVAVPHDNGKQPIDDGALYDSTVVATASAAGYAADAVESLMFLPLLSSER